MQMQMQIRAAWGFGLQHADAHAVPFLPPRVWQELGRREDAAVLVARPARRRRRHRFDARQLRHERARLLVEGERLVPPFAAEHAPIRR
jgi:hypothetical protein